MKLKLLSCLGMIGAAANADPQMVAQFDWKQLAEQRQLSGGEIQIEGGTTILKLSNTNSTPLQVKIFKISRPKISKTFYALTGEVKYDGIQGTGYLEMWNYFPPLKEGGPEGQFFSRTLGEGGEMGKLTGASNWRKFSLPFDRTGASGPPTGLEVNLYLPARGTVFLGPLRLVEYESGFTAGSTSQWWSERSAGLIGGICGAAFGTLAGLLGWLTARGKGRPFVLLSYRILIGCGLIFSLLGFVALTFGQPYAVWFPLLLLGVLLVSILPYRLKQSRRMYEDQELRRMTAVDVS